MHVVCVCVTGHLAPIKGRPCQSVRSELFLQRLPTTSCLRQCEVYVSEMFSQMPSNNSGLTQYACRATGVFKLRAIHEASTYTQSLSAIQHKRLSMNEALLLAQSHQALLRCEALTRPLLCNQLPSLLVPTCHAHFFRPAVAAFIRIAAN